MSDYIQLECSGCGCPPTLARDTGVVVFTCECSEQVSVPQLSEQSVLDPHSGLWSEFDEGTLSCRECKSRCTLHRLPADGYYVRCDCPNRSVAVDAIGDRPLFDPFEGKWADIDV